MVELLYSTSPHRTCRAHEALISMIECPFPAAVPLSPRPHEQTPSAAGRKADPFQAASTASKAPSHWLSVDESSCGVLTCDPPAARLCCAPLFPLARTLQADRVCMDGPQRHPTLSTQQRLSSHFSQVSDGSDNRDCGGSQHTIHRITGGQSASKLGSQTTPQVLDKRLVLANRKDLRG